MDGQVIELKDKINEAVIALEALGALVASSDGIYGLDVLLCCIAENLKATITKE